MKQLVFGIAAIVAIGAAAPVVAQQKVPVQFAKGASSATLKGTITGEQYRDYVVNARAGQTMTVTLTNPDGRAYFNVMAPGSTGEAVFIGSTEGNSFRGPVPGTGANTIRVYQMRATGRRGEVANYTLAIGIAGSAAGAAPAKAGYSDLVGARAAGALDEMERRGFANVDGFQSGSSGAGTVWWNGKTRQCVQIITVDGRIDSAVDIKTHPKCR
jgi:hypothetical protein